MKKFLFIIPLFLNINIYATTFTVTTNADPTGPIGTVSLRQAMTSAQSPVGAPHTINFNIPPLGSTQTIVLQSLLPDINKSVTLDGLSQNPSWTYGNNMPIVIDGSTLASSLISGALFLINSTSNCTIKGFAFRSYVGLINGYAIRINSGTAISDNNIITNCYFGCNADGTTTATPYSPFTNNTRSIVLSGNATFPVTNTVIGGATTQNGNLFVNTSVNAIAIQTNVQNTTIENNLFGTDITGTMAVGGNPYDIAIFGFAGRPCNGTSIINNLLSNNTLATAAAINLVSNVNDTTIINNKIGTNISGTSAIPNSGYAIASQGDVNLPCNNTQIINNIIAGNAQGGILLTDQTNNSIIQGNKIGTNSTGTAIIANDFGVAIAGDQAATNLPCSNNLIGGSDPIQSNLISGNNKQGILLITNVNNTIIQGNIIGTDITKNLTIPNNSGIELIGALNSVVNNNIIGGSSSSEGNIISGNTNEGIGLYTNSSNNIIRGNIIGTNGSLTTNLSNGTYGITIDSGISPITPFISIINTVIDPNLISRKITNKKTTYKITPLPCDNNIIGGTNANDANIIKFNKIYGVNIDGAITGEAILNPILHNSIFDNISKGINLTNNGNDGQIPPTLTSAQACNDLSIITISGNAPNSPIASNFRIEFFSNDINRNPITEGQTFIGAIPSIPSGQAFTQSFDISSLSLGSFISATATNLNNSGNTPGDTSEFSLNITTTMLPAFSVTTTPSSQTILPGNTINILANPTGGSGTYISYSWTGPNGFTANTQAITISNANASNAGIYSVTVTDSNGCTAIGHATVIIQTQTGLQSTLSKAIRAKYCAG